MKIPLANILSGFKSGLQQRSARFLGLAAVSVLIPVMQLVGACLIARETPTWTFILGIGPIVWVSLAFSIYLLCIASLQNFHRVAGHTDKLPMLAKQVDVIVSAMLFAIVVVPLLR